MTLLSVGLGSCLAQAQTPDFSLPALAAPPGSSVVAPPPAPGAIAQPKGAVPESAFAAKDEKKKEKEPIVENAIPSAIPELSDLAASAPPVTSIEQPAPEAAPPVGVNAQAAPGPAAIVPAIEVSATPDLPGFELPVPSAEQQAALTPVPTFAPPLPSSPFAVPIGRQPGEVKKEEKPRTPTWKTTLAPAIIPPKTDFNYRRQVLPDTIYRSSYDADNQHLPIALNKEEYGRQLQMAAANNDVNATRALLNAGAPTEGALSMARRYGAEDTAVLLELRGAQ